MHKLLLRQINKSLKHAKKTIPEEIKKLLNIVSSTYEDFDNDRELLERSMNLSSEEIEFSNKELDRKVKSQEEILQKLQAILISLGEVSNQKIDIEKIKDDPILMVNALKSLIEDHKQSQEELKKMNKFMIGRELRMVELKKEIKIAKK